MEKIRAKVIGTCAVGGVAPGGMVELDPDTVNIEALVYGGHIELSKTEARKIDRSDA